MSLPQRRTGQLWHWVSKSEMRHGWQGETFNFGWDIDS